MTSRFRKEVALFSDNWIGVVDVSKSSSEKKKTEKYEIPKIAKISALEDY